MVQLFAAEILQRATFAGIMAAMSILHRARSGGAFLKRPACCGDVLFLRHECKFKDGSNEYRMSRQ